MLTCSACGFANTPSDRFCGGCGQAAEAVAVAEPTAHQAVVQRRAGDGERKRVTVLFADLEGSTAAIEGLDPEAALGQIEPAVQIMMRLVHRYEGVVCRRLGDGILALFGAPVAHEDHAVRACFAGLGIQRELREAGMADRARVGLNSGEVLYRTIASDLGIEVDVVGPVVHVAARMEQLAPVGRRPQRDAGADQGDRDRESAPLWVEGRSSRRTVGRSARSPSRRARRGCAPWRCSASASASMRPATTRKRLMPCGAASSSSLASCGLSGSAPPARPR